MIPVKLLKHYRPVTMAFNILEDVPAPLPGIVSEYKDKKDGPVVGKKLWAGTIVELPADEAKRLLFNEQTVLEPRLGADGKPVRNYEGDMVRVERQVKFPLAERADPLPA